MKLFPLVRTAASALLIATALSSCQTRPVGKFLVADTNKDGALDAKELDEHITLSFMCAYDANNDFGITWAEWQAVSPNADKAKFRKRDTNRDSRISESELLAVVRDHPTFGNLMQSVDTNGDKLAQSSEVEAFQKRKCEL